VTFARLRASRSGKQKEGYINRKVRMMSPCKETKRGNEMQGMEVKSERPKLPSRKFSPAKINQSSSFLHPF
jgi:hypothetical protein